MARRKEGKRIKAQRTKVEADKLYNLEEACQVVASTASAKFDETVDVAVRLGVDPKKADQNVRGSISSTRTWKERARSGIRKGREG